MRFSICSRSARRGSFIQHPEQSVVWQANDDVSLAVSKVEVLDHSSASVEFQNEIRVNRIIWPILHSLRKKGMTLSEISKNSKMTQKKALPELMVLQSKDILIPFSKSHRTYYRLADDRILQALDLMLKTCQRKAKRAETNGLARKTSRIFQRCRA